MKGHMIRLNQLKKNSETKEVSIHLEEVSFKDIAIIGIQVKLPHSDSQQEFFQKIRNGVELVSDFPGSRKKDVLKYYRWKGKKIDDLRFLKGSYLSEVDTFDSSFFRIPPREASLMNPLQRLFLETTWGALEDAGYGGKELAGSNTGVYFGLISDLEGYKYKLMINDIEPPESHAVSVPGNLTSIIPGRISYILDLKGPNMIVDTACSSSLVALHIACQAIRNGECDQAIVGSGRISLFPLDEQFKIGMESSDGRTRTFDDGSDGTGFGEGIISMLIKPVKRAEEDGDHIYAVIKGSAVNQDGTSTGITAPNADSQAKVLINAWKNAGIDPETLSYIEAHGTGTKLGDPIEIEGIHKAFARFTRKKQFCAIGSVKSNTGHLFEAAGLTGVVKAVMALKNREIPPSIHFTSPNCRIHFEDSPVYINDRLRYWEPNGTVRRCGISSFGFSGTNCHVVLEEAPQPVPVSHQISGTYVFTLSAKSRQSLSDLILRYKNFANRNQDVNIRDLCFTSNIGRGHYQFRMAFIVSDPEDLCQSLNELNIAALENLESDSVFYGWHKETENNENDIRPGEIGRKDKARLSNSAGEILKKYFGSEDKAVKDLIQLCRCYVQGADVCWDEFYNSDKPKRISLPVYVFQKDRHWIQIPEPKGGYPSEIDEKPGLFHEIKWRNVEIQNQHTWPQNGCVVIFKDEAGFSTKVAKRLRLKGSKVIEVALQEDFPAFGPDHYRIRNIQEDYIELFKRLGHQEEIRILHLGTWRENPSEVDISKVKEELMKGVYSLLFLTRAILSGDLYPKVKILVVSKNVHEVTGKEADIRPYEAAMFGLARGIRRDPVHLDIHCMDIDEHVCPDDLINEMLSGDDADIAAYRDGKRYVEELDTLSVDSKGLSAEQLKEEGVYVITGGLGGIGMEIAGFLASKKGVRIALIARKSLPPRDQWDEAALEHMDAGLGDKIKRIKEIESTGTSVLYYRADVSVPEEIGAVLSELRQQFGRINGVFHCAGSSRQQKLCEKDDQTFDEVLMPKVAGTLNLYHFTTGDNPDFFILFSSIVSLIGLPGNEDYTAANLFMDVFSSFCRKAGRNALTLNWGAWKETGMAVQNGSNVDNFFKAILTKDALVAFEDILNCGLSRVVVGGIHYQYKNIHLMDPFLIRLSDRMRDKIQPMEKDKLPTRGAAILAGHEEDKETGEITGQASEDVLLSIMKDVLGFKEIDPYESFFDLGIDSILLGQVFIRLQKLYPGEITVSDIFENPTIKKLSGIIDQKKTKKNEAKQRDTIPRVVSIGSLLDRMDEGELTIDSLIDSLKEI